ncbi:molecular chaperone [Erwinia endophytica]|uniref:fimbrial biogenesis chaperone n=1 Tax=Erwinia endophytica TaxID=1563158 RepID=UPI001265E6BE|nr:molecular chaperone [Erwinia endophytica]KAB8313333.1 molecular chaperone [Erwinia endophytica]
MKRMAGLLAGMLALIMTCSAIAEDNGGVSFSRNRIIFPASERAVSLTVTNHGDSVYLVQAGVSGEPDRRTKAPFIVTPPLFRLEGQAENTLRIMSSGGSLPRDRESVFYFTGLVIPSVQQPTAAAVDSKLSATLSVSMRSVMKLFWRPSGLKPAPEKAPDELRFSRTPQGLRVTNPTPYYQSFAELSIDGEDINLDQAPSMVAPFGDITFTAKGPAHSVTWRVMNDYGGTTLVKTQAVTQ